MSKNKEIAKQIIVRILKHPRYKIDLYASIGNAKRTHIDAVLCELESNGIVRIKPSCDMVQPTEKTADAIIALEAEKSPPAIPEAETSAVIETPQPPVTIPVASQKPPPETEGLIIDNHCTRDAASKKEAAENLNNLNLQQVLLTPQQWIKALENGKTIVPGIFTRTENGTFTRSQQYWQGTYSIYADADNIKGVEYNDNGIDSNPAGVEAWTDADGLLRLYPSLKSKAFAIGESVSSMHKTPPHRRHRIKFLFNKPITSKHHYHTILQSLASEFGILPAKDRSPVQPVFGNAREGHNQFTIYGNILNLDDYPIPPEPPPRTQSPASELSQRERQHIDSFIAKMGITWDNGKSQYFAKRYCEKTEHKNLDGKAVQYFLNPDGSINGYCNGCSEFWYITPPPKRKAPLQINTENREARKAQLCDAVNVHNTLDADISDFMQAAPPADTPQYLIMKQETGTGKSTTTLTRANEDGKKVLSLLFNHELAQQQETTAAEIGYNAFRFRGRGYNFDKSPLAKLPVKMRREDETLFKKFNVMCPVYDELKPYIKKRISPWVKCFKCPLREACQKEGFLSQYAEMKSADYVSVCKPDAIFNPDMWTFLNIILTGKIPFDTTETDEEIAIGYMLGLDTEAAEADNFQSFDFAIVDDYTTAGLYVDAHYTLDEINDLKTAWKGTRTGDFCAKLFDAVLLLYDKEGTQRGFDALKSLFDNTDENAQAEINEDLTKHPEADDNGNLEILHPWTAIKKGIPLEDISPVWHSKEWTILHQLQTILNHTKNENQAPMFLDKEGNITLSLPPQAHPRLKKVMLMSATADIDGTKNAFTGQPINWQVSEGKQPRLATGVKLFQYTDARLTKQTIFETLRDANGNPVFDDDKKPITTGELTPKTQQLMEKIIAMVRSDNRKSLFTSYKEFTEAPFIDSPIGKELHAAFDTVTHYDMVSGQNFDDYKNFINFGLPKIDLRTVETKTRRQYAHDPQPLCFDDYETVTETAEGYTSETRKYKDPRVEKVRQQLTQDKLKQTTGRGRQTRWENTWIINLCAEPLPGFTALAEPLTYTRIMEAETLDFEKPTTPDPPAYMTTAEKVLKTLREHPEMTQSEIARFHSITPARISQIVNNAAKLNFDANTMYVLNATCVTNLTNSSTQSQHSCKALNGDKLKPFNAKIDKNRNSRNGDKNSRNGDKTLSNNFNGDKYHKNIEKQILNLFANTTREIKTSEITQQITGARQKVNAELSKLVQTGKIAKVSRGTYKLAAPIATAENVTERTHPHNEKKRDSEIIRLHAEGHSDRKIAMHISKEFSKVLPDTVKNVITSHIENAILTQEGNDYDNFRY